MGKLWIFTSAIANQTWQWTCFHMCLWFSQQTKPPFIQKFRDVHLFLWISHRNLHLYRMSYISLWFPLSKAPSNSTALSCRSKVKGRHLVLSAVHRHFNMLRGMENSSGWWLQPLWKIWKSVGMITPNIWKQMFQTTNQSWCRKVLLRNMSTKVLVRHIN